MVLHIKDTVKKMAEGEEEEEDIERERERENVKW